jgi:hypothetical protein
MDSRQEVNPLQPGFRVRKRRLKRLVEKEELKEKKRRDWLSVQTHPWWPEKVFSAGPHMTQKLDGQGNSAT